MTAQRDADADPLAPYRAILEHAELELELAGRAELEQLHALAQRWQELTRGLPSPPPPAAAVLIERATLIGERTRIELERVQELLLSELETVRRARAAADGYGKRLAARPALERSA
jgi:hypothetical protein